MDGNRETHQMTCIWFGLYQNTFGMKSLKSCWRKQSQHWAILWWMSKRPCVWTTSLKYHCHSYANLMGFSMPSRIIYLWYNWTMICRVSQKNSNESYALISLITFYSPCTHMPIHEGFVQRAWFPKTPSRMFAIGPLGCKSTISLRW